VHPDAIWKKPVNYQNTSPEISSHKLDPGLGIPSLSSYKEMRICTCIAVGDPVIKRREIPLTGLISPHM
jgi:hypothetical protein